MIFLGCVCTRHKCISVWVKAKFVIYLLLSEYGMMNLWRNLWSVLNQPYEAPLVSGTVPGCRILAKYLRRKNDLEIFTVVKKKLYLSSYKADIQAQVNTPFENSLLSLILWEKCENVVWGQTPGSWEPHTSCRGGFWAVSGCSSMQLTFFQIT